MQTEPEQLEPIDPDEPVDHDDDGVDEEEAKRGLQMYMQVDDQDDLSSGIIS